MPRRKSFVVKLVLQQPRSMSDGTNDVRWRWRAALCVAERRALDARFQFVANTVVVQYCRLDGRDCCRYCCCCGRRCKCSDCSRAFFFGTKSNRNHEIFVNFLINFIYQWFFVLYSNKNQYYIFSQQQQTQYYQLRRISSTQCCSHAQLQQQASQQQLLQHDGCFVFY